MHNDKTWWSQTYKVTPMGALHQKLEEELLERLHEKTNSLFGGKRSKGFACSGEAADGRASK